MKQSDNKTQITIFNKDRSKRVINVIGNWNLLMAKSLAQDIEGQNMLSVSVQVR